jgi:hypothetical protein
MPSPPPTIRPMPIPYVTPEDVEAVLAKPGLYVSLPIENSDDAAELFNRLLDHLQGEQET